MVQDQALVAGAPYRLRALAPPAHVLAVRRAHGERGQKELLRDIEQRIEVAGFSPVLAVLEDPTDSRVFHAIARYRDSGEESGLVLEHHERVEEPPADSGDADCLDPGLTADEVWAVRVALARDTNPRHLYGLSDTFRPFFPVASSLVRAKANLCEGQADRNMRDLCEANEGALDDALAELEGSEREEAAEALTSPKAAPVDAVISALRDAGARWADAEAALRLLVVPTYPWAWRSRVRGPPAGQAPDDLRAALERYAAETLVSGRGLPLSVARDEVRRVACDIIAGEEALTLKAPRPVRELGAALVTEAGYGIDLVRLSTLAKLLPVTGGEGYVSPTALQLALATFKPSFAHVVDRGQMDRRMDSLAGAKPEHMRALLLARNQMERAERALERRRWVEWYRRAGW